MNFKHTIIPKLETELLDWDIRIENPPRKMGKTVTMDFVHVWKKKPRIREFPDASH